MQVHDCIFIMFCIHYKIKLEKESMKHMDFNEVEHYLRSKQYPEWSTSKGEKSNFHRLCVKCCFKDGQLQFRDKPKFRIVVRTKEEQLRIIKNVDLFGDSHKARDLFAHYGRDAINYKILPRDYWHGMKKDILYKAMRGLSKNCPKFNKTSVCGFASYACPFKSYESD